MEGQEYPKGDASQGSRVEGLAGGFLVVEWLQMDYRTGEGGQGVISWRCGGNLGLR